MRGQQKSDYARQREEGGFSLDAFVALGTPAHQIMGPPQVSQVSRFALPERQIAIDELFDEDIDRDDIKGYDQ